MRHGCAVLVLALLPAPLPAQSSRPAGAGELLGCWRRDGAGTALIRVEPGRISFFRNGTLEIYRAAFAAGKVIVFTSGLRGEYEASVRDGVLTVAMGKEKETYRRLDAVPDALVPKPLELGKEDPDAEQLGAIRRELSSRVKVDQEVRKDPSRAKDMPEVDQRNTAWLVQTVARHGWLDATRFGAQAAGQAFLLVQHSGQVPLMMAALPGIEADVKARRADPQDYALLCDRLRLRLGERQLYGSQIGTNMSGEQVVLALEDPANVDQRRKAIGLLPLADYLALFQRQNGGKPVKFEEER